MATLTTPDILWGKTGHRVVGELASQRISKRTLKKNQQPFRWGIFGSSLYFW